MRFGLIYAAPGLYNMVLWALYQARPRERFEVVAAEVEPGDSVVDLCAGTALLYEVLVDKGVDYRAFDLNPRFVAALRDRGIAADCRDIATMEIPRADVVTMSSALYHFYPRCGELVERMHASARKKVVLVEPVRNNADSRLPLWGAFARWMSRVDGRDVPFHFDRDSLSGLLDGLAIPVSSRRVICGGRDMCAVLPGSGEK